MARAPWALPAGLWLWAAPAIVVVQVAAKLVGEDFYRTWMRGELGLVENLTVVFLAGGVVCSVLCYRMRAKVRWRFFGSATLVFTAGLVFFACEEASWGQHWFGFEPHASFAERNEQGEFNLHNDPLLETVLDQLPRTLLTLAALVGGVIAPLVRRRRVSPDFSTAGPSGWAWPDPRCLPAALLAVTVSLPEKAFEAFDRSLPHVLEISPGETKEYGLALFLFVYALSLVRDLGQASRPAGAA